MQHESIYPKVRVKARQLIFKRLNFTAWLFTQGEHISLLLFGLLSMHDCYALYLACRLAIRLPPNLGTDKLPTGQLLMYLAIDYKPTKREARQAFAKFAELLELANLLAVINATTHPNCFTRTIVNKHYVVRKTLDEADKLIEVIELCVKHRFYDMNRILDACYHLFLTRPIGEANKWAHKLKLPSDKWLLFYQMWRRNLRILHGPQNG